MNQYKIEKREAGRWIVGPGIEQRMHSVTSLSPFTRKRTKVQHILKTCGPWAAARYCKNRGYSPEQAITLMYR